MMFLLLGKIVSMMGISSLRNFVTDSMAIDMGTANTIIAVKGRDVVLDEPTCVAVNELTDEIVAYGQEAYDMLGREGRDVNIIAPLSGGVVRSKSATTPPLSGAIMLTSRPSRPSIS